MKHIILACIFFSLFFFSCKKDYRVVNPVAIRYQLYDSVLGNGPFVHIPIDRVINFTYFPSTQDYWYLGLMLDKASNLDSTEYTYYFPQNDFGPSSWMSIMNDTIKIRYIYSSHTKMDVYGYRLM